ncbi:MAG: hypothetical protein R3A13_12730 [Bdellovibrionota bacterium]
MCEFLSRILKVEPIIYRRRVAFYTKDRCFDVSKMQDLLGFEPKYSNYQGLRQTLDWYLAQGWIKTTEKKV